MVIVIVFYLIDKTVLDVNDFIRLVSHTTLVSYHYYCHVFLFVEFLQKIHNLNTRLLIEGSRRLVGKDYLWMGYECPGYCHSLFLTSRHFVWIMICPR